MAKASQERREGKTLQARWLDYVLDVKLLTISGLLGGLAAYVVWELIGKLISYFLGMDGQALGPVDEMFVMLAQSAEQGGQAAGAGAAGAGVTGGAYKGLFNLTGKNSDPPELDE